MASSQDGAAASARGHIPLANFRHTLEKTAVSTLHQAVEVGSASEPPMRNAVHGHKLCKQSAGRELPEEMLITRSGYAVRAFTSRSCLTMARSSESSNGF
jgi:hypothetical protein